MRDDRYVILDRFYMDAEGSDHNVTDERLDVEWLISHHEGIAR